MGHPARQARPDGRGAADRLEADILIAVAAVLLAYGLAASRRLGDAPNDVEASMLGLWWKAGNLRARWRQEFPGQGEMPRYYPWRLPLEYALWTWASDRGIWKYPRLRLARCAGGVVGGVGVGLGAAWTWQRTESWVALAIYALIIVGCPTLMQNLVSASYVPYVATLWTAGLFALDAGYPLVAASCGLWLAFLRPTSWWQAAFLIVADGLWILIPGLAVAIGVCYPEVVRSQGWYRLVARTHGPAVEHGGWGYAAKVATKRYWMIGLAALGGVAWSLAR